MRILIGWDDAAEAELISLYLNANDNEAVVLLEPAEFLARARGDEDWDVILMTISMPDSDGAFEVFQELRTTCPESPIVGACQTEDVFRLARFITNGMRSYVLRDVGGDFVFLLQTTLESTVKAIRAEREQRVAEKMREEIESVRRFQESILPKKLHTPIGYRISAAYEPSQIREVGGQPVILAGGDYYDVIKLNDKNIVLILGDAAGHGMRACMSIMVMQTLMNVISTRSYRKTATFVAEVNRRFCEQSVNKKDGSLITLLYGILKVDRNEFQWTSAGHPIPILQERNTSEIGPVAADDFAGTPLGVDPGMKYSTHTVSIPPASRLLLYSDGLVEVFAAGDKSHLFGEEGVMETLTRTRNESVDTAMQSLLDDSHAFTRGIGRHDDTSALLLERM